MFNPDPKPNSKKKVLTSKEYKEAIKKRGNKFNAKKSNYNGYNYDSNLEASYAMQLDVRLKLGEIKSWKRQYKIDLIVKGKLWRPYKIDYRVEYFNGVIEYVEVKGFPTAEWKQKWDLLLIIREDVLEPGSKITLWTKKGQRTY